MDEVFQLINPCYIINSCLVLLQVFPNSLILQSQGLNLVSQFLVVFKQSSVICMDSPDLLHEILGTCALLLVLHALRESLICLYDLTLVVDDDGLELVPLAYQLLSFKLHFLLHLHVLSQKGVPFPLALFLTPVVLIKESLELSELLCLTL